MKKRLCILLIAALLLMLVPHAASANAPVRNPRELQIECENVVPESKIDVVLLSESGVTRTAEDVFQPAADRTKGHIYILFEDGETAFCLRITAPDGTETRTDEAQIVEYGCYRYDGAENRLVSDGTYYSRGSGCGEGVAYAALMILMLIAPLGLTLLLEFLTSLCFGIRPRKYVIIANLMTNPAMNVLLLILALAVAKQWVYWTALALLESAVVALEFLFYTKKYPETARPRLFAFTLTANLLSFAAAVAIWMLL